jgi:hypothetical protein
MTQDYTVEQIQNIVAEAREAARIAATDYFNQKLGGVDQYACGFAHVEIFGIKGNSRLGKAFKAAGVEKNYTGAYSIWNPSGLSVQNIDVKEAGAEAAAAVFERYGFSAYAGSRLD